jgi:hypothetical protein
MLRILNVALLAALLIACATPYKSIYSTPDGKTLVINQAEWAGFQKYLSMIGSTRPGAFSLQIANGETTDYHYSLCEYDSCYGGPSYPQAAMDLCLKHGGECVLFASNREILVNYKLAGE